MKYLISIFILIFSGTAMAQKFEAEDAALTGGAEKMADSNVSGGYYVAQKDGHLTFDVSLDEEAFYNIYVYAASPSGPKINKFSINHASIDFRLEQDAAYNRIKVISSLKLAEGAHEIAIYKSWGWINIDYIEFEITDTSERFNISPVPVTPDPTDHAARLYRFLYDHYGKRIISGAMTLNSMDEINWLKTNTGKEPALIGLDFMHCGRGYSWYNDEEPVNDAKKYYARNGIPAFCWHWRDPLRKTEAFYTKDTSFDISKINDENSAEYKAMLKDIDYISGLLKKLQDAGVPVLWRPLHEASGGWFWWGAKGAEPCKKLYRLMYDRMVNYHGLKNMIWVWTSQQNDTSWYPGDDVVDIIGRDIYKDGDHSSQILEFNQLNEDAGGAKMITLSETGSFPDVENLINDGAPWSYFMPWYGDFVRSSKYNPLDLWKKMFAHTYVLTLDEMPDLKTYTASEPSWRSQLYPENWKPGFMDPKGRFLHDFSYAGYHQGEMELPYISDPVIDVSLPPYSADTTGKTDVTAIIQKALDDAGQAGGGVVYLPKGTYRVNPGTGEHALQIRHNQVILRGAGVDSTFILNDASFMRQKNIIYVMNGWATWSEASGTTTRLNTDLLYPTRIIPVESVNGFKKGDHIILRTDGTQAFAEEHGMGGIWVDWAARVMFHRTIDSIDTENNLIYIDSPTRYFMKKRDNARVYHAKDHITECGIENLSIGNIQNDKEGWDEETYHEQGTGAYDAHASHAIQFKYAINCWIKKVNTYKPSSNSQDVHLLSNGVLLNQCRGITVDSCFFQKPQYEGGGGNGYMYTLSSNDCLIKNSRANHSRHNYDFKFPYSNGNVIHNCIAENSKYSSDFHMYLSMANLFDVTNVDKDYLESQFRPWGGDVVHGYSSTQSVFYNTTGVAYHPNRDYIIDSRQFKHGYIIGTQGEASNVKLDPVAGTTNGYQFDTAPRDFAEGIGTGAGLVPQSLYLDQLRRRMEDSTGLPAYKVSIRVKHSFTGEPVENSNVQIYQQVKTTGTDGSAEFDNQPGLLVIAVGRNDFYPLVNQQVTIYSDTTLTFTLVPKEYNVTLVVHDQISGDVFSGVPVSFGTANEVTNLSGEVHFQAYDGEFSFTIDKLSYTNQSGILTIHSDTTIHFYLSRSAAFIKFRIKENGSTPVNNAIVILNQDTLSSNNLGIATFRDLSINSIFDYKIYKGGYNDLTGSFTLTTDTTLNLEMVPYVSSQESNAISSFLLWPNPAGSILYIRFPQMIAQGIIRIYESNGSCLKTQIFTEQQLVNIALEDLRAGIYLLKIVSGDETVTRSFVKQ